MRHSHHPYRVLRVKTEKNGVKQEMDGYEDTLQPDQIAALTAYVRSLGK